MSASSITRRSHIDYFDYIRAISTFAVVYLHTASYVLGTYDDLQWGLGNLNLQWGLLNLCTSFAFTAVPLFFMMSGYLLLSDERTADLSVLFRKRLPHLVVPLASWSVLGALQLLHMQHNWSLAAFRSLMAQALRGAIYVHFWYLYMLVAFYVLSPLLYGCAQSLDRKGRLYLAALIGIVSLQAIAAALLPDRFDRYATFDIISKLRDNFGFSGHLFTFFLGYLLGRMRKIPNWFLIAACVVLMGIISAGSYIYTIQSGGNNQTFLNQSAGFEVLLAACIFLLFKQNAKPTRLFRAVPLIPLCLTIYLMHCILLNELHVFGFYPQDFLSTMAMTVVIFVLCYLTAKTAATIKPLCFLITGMTFRSACESCNWVYTYRNVRVWITRYRGKTSA